MKSWVEFFPKFISQGGWTKNVFAGKLLKKLISGGHLLGAKENLSAPNIIMQISCKKYGIGHVIHLSYDKRFSGSFLVKLVPRSAEISSHVNHEI